MTQRHPSAQPGEFYAIGRRDDTGDIVVSIVDDIPKKTTLSEICQRVLYEIGKKDPLVYEFVALIYAPEKGGMKTILDQTQLRRFVYAIWGKGSK